jgi:hypothetical protein
MHSRFDPPSTDTALDQSSGKFPFQLNVSLLVPDSICSSEAATLGSPPENDKTNQKRRYIQMFQT